MGNVQNIWNFTGRHLNKSEWAAGSRATRGWGGGGCPQAPLK